MSPLPHLELEFFGWARAGVYDTVPNNTLTQGRLTGQVALALHDQENLADTVTGTVSFDILGPGDVAGLQRGAVARVSPPPGTRNAEETKCPYVELSAPDLPWRYTPRRAQGAALPPWLVLVTAKNDGSEAKLEPGSKVTLSAVPLAVHPLGQSARWAHVQDDGNRRVARILSPRNLDPKTAYLALLVPAFTDEGAPAWNANTTSVTLPVLHRWVFTTGPEGDFPSLAGRLKPTKAEPDLGRAPVFYRPLPGTADLSVRGALAPIGVVDGPVEQAVADDLGLVTTLLFDPLRPIVSVPNYGAPWARDPAATTWGAEFRTNPRHRSAAGMGLWSGVLEQELLSNAAAAQAGALDAAAQRIRHLATGLAVARSLWNRRLPTDPLHRLAIFGPALRNMLTTTGTALDALSGGTSPLPAEVFSTAARRVLRMGPARTSGATPGATDPSVVLDHANHCPPPPSPTPEGLPNIDAFIRADPRTLNELIRTGLRPDATNFPKLEQLIAGFFLDAYSDVNLKKRFTDAMAFWLNEQKAGKPLPVTALLAILDSPTGKPPNAEELAVLLDALEEFVNDPERDSASLLALGELILAEEPASPCQTPDIMGIAVAIGEAIDPTVDRPFVVDRVLSTISGLEPPELAPPELCPDLDIPAWQLLRDHAPDWLLPGAQSLPEDSVVAVETNASFVDAFLMGLNTQMLSELRFHNVPIRTGCTPLRQFWARANPVTNTFDDDITGVNNWPADSALGSVAHETPASADTDLVVVFCSPLFRRYPRTIVYLTPAVLVNGKPAWNGNPDFDQRLLPVFQGTITPDITFFGFNLDPAEGARHWVVLEEPPHGFQFFNTLPGGPSVDLNNAQDGGTFAHLAFADPYRVMIRGESLIPLGTP